MTASGPKSLAAIGFLTVVEHPQHGLFGGYLVLNPAGRPLEFHCTAPVKPNRAQEILYGPTLRPYLYGEQIGYALLSKAKQEPLWVCTDSDPVLAVRDLVTYPVVFVHDAAAGELSSTADDAGGRIEQAVRQPEGCPCGQAHDWAGLFAFSLGQFRVYVSAKHKRDQQTVVDLWQTHADALDLIEPFDRIRDAIEEAQRMAA
jgi:hypothetical protein